VIDKRVQWNAHDEPEVVITVQGWSDVIRLTEHLAAGQVEFATTARRIYHSVDKRLGRPRRRQLVEHFTGRKSWC